jgi:hypothetical protein
VIGSIELFCLFSPRISSSLVGLHNFHITTERSISRSAGPSPAVANNASCSVPTFFLADDYLTTKQLLLSGILNSATLSSSSELDCRLSTHILDRLNRSRGRSRSQSHFTAVSQSVSQYVLVSSPLCGRLTRYCFLLKSLDNEVRWDYFTTDAQSVCLGIEHPCGTCDQMLLLVGMLLPEICSLVSVWRPLWREDGAAICSGTSHAELVTMLYCLIWDSPKPGGPGPRIYIPQKEGGPVIPPGTLFVIQPLMDRKENCSTIVAQQPCRKHVCYKIVTQ